jgi:hypothetical protein
MFLSLFEDGTVEAQMANTCNVTCFCNCQWKQG